MIITNARSLATTQTRRHALEIVNAGLESVLTKPLMHKQIKVSGNMLTIGAHRWNLSHYERILVVGAGKAAADMAASIESIFGRRITGGIVIDTRAHKLSRIKVVKGTHPLTSHVNVKATEDIMELLESATERDLVLCLISGGGSALMDAPRIPLSKQIEINKLLLKRGATIQEINTVRKHISFVKGGQLAELVYPATVITLMISDVITNDMSVIASGPTVPDATRVSDAIRVQKKYRLPELPFIETPKHTRGHVSNILLATNVLAANAMKSKAHSLGYHTRVLTTCLNGEAREVGKRLARMIRPGVACIAAGETTVTVRGKGMGGRNQELTLAASQFIVKPGVVLSCSSDGVDFITQAAGGIVDERTKETKLDIDTFLDNNDSYHALSKINGIIKTGKTGTNVGDVMLALGSK